MTLTTNGLDLIKLTALNSLDGITHVGFGTDSVAPVISDTTLSSELSERITVTATQNTSDYTFEARVPKSKFNTTLTKMALFDAASSGNMGAAEQFSSSFTKTSNDEILVTYRINVTAVNN